MALPKIFTQAANGLLNLTPYGAPAPYLRLDTAAASDMAEPGTFKYNASEDTFDFYLAGGGIGQAFAETWRVCYNNTASTIPSGTPVYVTPAATPAPDRPKIAPASAATAATSCVIGVTTDDIAPGGTGRVTVMGDLNGMNTTGFAQDDELWLGVTAGTLVNAMPGNGYQRVRIGIVTRVHANAGRIQVAPYRFPMANELLRDTWDDLPFLKGAKTGVSAPTYAQFGSTAFWGWKMASGNIFYADDVQISHAWDELVIRPHIHFSSDNGGVGPFTMEHRIMSRPAGSGAWSTETISTKTWNGTLAAGGCAALDLYDGTGFQPANPGASTLFKAVLTMTAKTFTGNIFIDGWDAHYKSDKFGTETEY